MANEWGVLFPILGIVDLKLSLEGLSERIGIASAPSVGFLAEPGGRSRPKFDFTCSQGPGREVSRVTGECCLIVLAFGAI